MSTVLWGGRKGDVQYASYAYWSRNLRIGVPTMTVDSGAYFAPGLTVDIVPMSKHVPAQTLRIDSMEGDRIAVLPVTRP